MDTLNYCAWPNLCLWNTAYTSRTLVVHVLYSEISLDYLTDKVAVDTHSSLNTSQAAELFVPSLLPFSDQTVKNIKIATIESFGKDLLSICIALL